MKENRVRKKAEDYRKYMYALQLRAEAASRIGIENIRRARLSKIQKEKERIEQKNTAGSQIYPDFKLILMAKLEA